MAVVVMVVVMCKVVMVQELARQSEAQPHSCSDGSGAMFVFR